MLRCKTRRSHIRSTDSRANPGLAALQTVSSSQADENPANYSDMNCRRLAVFAILPGVLVHMGDDAIAAGPTYRQATAAATILPSATAKADTDGSEKGKRTNFNGSQSVTTKYIDEDGFVTTAANPRRHIVHIIDLP
jgi:hypothetical protein